MGRRHDDIAYQMLSYCFTRTVVFVYAFSVLLAQTRPILQIAVTVFGNTRMFISFGVAMAIGIVRKRQKVKALC